ncbi:hypothetical protein [Paenibacillus dokdonensis]|uniref:hypothetical protein n=1 Tax=Paenibacillus dokdonensis TaxID=2567944 RepID=UPI0010A8469B|nr:hypothetical protein [Paenibacillus dokdonensis]
MNRIHNSAPQKNIQPLSRRIAKESVVMRERMIPAVLGTAGSSYNMPAASVPASNPACLPLF